MSKRIKCHQCGSKETTPQSNDSYAVWIFCNTCGNKDLLANYGKRNKKNRIDQFVHWAENLIK